MAMGGIVKGDRVRVHYRAYNLAGHMLVDTTVGEAVLMIAGGDDSIRGLSQGVLGMEVGETKSLQLSPSDAFGGANQAVLRTISYSRLQRIPQVGEMLRLTCGDLCFALWVVDVREKEAVVSSQHPLVGKPLDLRLEIVSVD